MEAEPREQEDLEAKARETRYTAVRVSEATRGKDGTCPWGLAGAGTLAQASRSRRTEAGASPGPGPEEERGRVQGGSLFSSRRGAEPVAGRLFTLALACLPERRGGSRREQVQRAGAALSSSPLSSAVVSAGLSVPVSCPGSATDFLSRPSRACSGSRPAPALTHRSGSAISRHLSSSCASMPSLSWASLLEASPAFTARVPLAHRGAQFRGPCEVEVQAKVIGH